MSKFLNAARKSEYFYFYLVGLLFVLLNSLFIVNNIYVFYSISFLIIIFIAAFKKLEYIYFTIIALTPLSISLSDFIEKGSIDISLFTEPLLLLILFLLLFKLFNTKTFSIPKSLHVISLVFIVQLLWMLFATYNSTIPLVSLKMFLARLWFLIPIYFLGLEYFKDFKKIKLFLWLHGGTLIIIVIYATIRLIGTGFSSANASHLVVKPFYNDHTAYGAIVTFLAPVFILFSFTKNLKKWQKLFSITISVFLLAAIVLSYSRAAWVAFAVSVVAFICIRLKIRFVYLISVLVVFVLTFWFLRFQIIDSLSKNSQDSSNDLSKHLESVTNITTDASNVERINRWYCAIEMFQNKPFFGWGPGTYQFQYAIYQVMRMRTVISTNDGDWVMHIVNILLQ
jgi:O-antigen ligase